MVSITNFEVFNFEQALRGMRHPLESYDRGDSYWVYGADTTSDGGKTIRIGHPQYIIGPNDMELAQKLIKAGPEHCKFLRQIFVTMEITGPLYWWKEMDTYKISTVANSTSTMHKLMSKPFSIDMFSFDDWEGDGKYATVTTMEGLINYLEILRQEYINLKDEGADRTAKKLWRSVIQMLPESFNQTRTWTGNYAILRNQVEQRAGHKQSEWADYIDVVHDSAPYSEELIFYKGDK